MSLFDESAVEAGHKRLASSVSAQVEALAACTDLIRKGTLSLAHPRNDPTEHANFLAVSANLAFRAVNGVGAATKLLDCGYFVQAAAIGRDLAEIGMLVQFFVEQPDKITDWRTTKQRYQEFGRSQLRKGTSRKDRLSFFDHYFNLFSEFGTHPSANSIVAHHDGNGFHIGPHVNEALYVAIYQELAVLNWRVTQVLSDLAKATLGFDVEAEFPAEASRYHGSWAGISSQPSPPRHPRA